MERCTARECQWQPSAIVPRQIDIDTWSDTALIDEDASHMLSEDVWKHSFRFLGESGSRWDVSGKLLGRLELWTSPSTCQIKYPTAIAWVQQEIQARTPYRQADQTQIQRQPIMVQLLSKRREELRWRMLAYYFPSYLQPCSLVDPTKTPPFCPTYIQQTARMSGGWQSMGNQVNKLGTGWGAELTFLAFDGKHLTAITTALTGLEWWGFKIGEAGRINELTSDDCVGRRFCETCDGRLEEVDLGLAWEVHS